MSQEPYFLKLKVVDQAVLLEESVKWLFKVI